MTRSLDAHDARTPLCILLSAAACSWAGLVSAQPEDPEPGPEVADEEAGTETASPAPAETPAPAKTPAPAPVIDEAMLGGPGESCRARADCQSGLRCIDATCVDEREGTSCQTGAECGSLKCIDNV